MLYFSPEKCTYIRSLEMDIVSSRYYAYVNGTYDVQQIELSHFYNNGDALQGALVL